MENPTDMGLLCISYLRDHPERVVRMAKIILLAYARYPTIDKTNLFVVGKTGERAFMDAIQGCGYSVSDVSLKTSVDVLVCTTEFSVKTSINVGSITLVNYRGKKKTIGELPPSILILFDRKGKQMHILYVNNALIESIPFPRDKYSNSDSHLAFTDTFVKHLVKTLDTNHRITIELPDLDPSHCVTMNMMDFVWADILSCL
jgi:hypothetical protein